jgi:hypothetical protein
VAAAVQAEMLVAAALLADLVAAEQTHPAPARLVLVQEQQIKDLPAAPAHQAVAPGAVAVPVLLVVIMEQVAVAVLVMVGLDYNLLLAEREHTMQVVVAA